MPDLSIQPLTRPFVLRMSPPGSKSLTNRALVLAAMADGVSDLRNALFADDTLVMLEGLTRLGFTVQADEGEKRIRVSGRAGQIDRSDAQLFCGNSGTTLRFLAALCALGKGHFHLDGVARMRQRPVRGLTDMLRHLGVRVTYVLEEGYPPIEVLADGLPGGVLHYQSQTSSQYLSAVLMAAPYARHELRVELDGPVTSWPYVEMTMRLMDEFHHTPELIRDPQTHEPETIIVPRGKYKGGEYLVEPDASNASYFLAAAALHADAEVTIEGLGRNSLQGDVKFVELLKRMGAAVTLERQRVSVRGTGELAGIDADLRDMPDVAQTLAVLAVFAEGETRLSGLHTLRVKETDRLAALKNELTKLGTRVQIDGDTLVIEPPARPVGAAIDTYDDHRMAMSFALAGTKIPGVTIRNAECVNKTYPTFFEDFEKMAQ